MGLISELASERAYIGIRCHTLINGRRFNTIILFCCCSTTSFFILKFSHWIREHVHVIAYPYVRFMFIESYMRLHRFCLSQQCWPFCASRYIVCLYACYISNSATLLVPSYPFSCRLVTPSHLLLSFDRTKFRFRTTDSFDRSFWKVFLVADDTLTFSDRVELNGRPRIEMFCENVGK